MELNAENIEEAVEKLMDVQQVDGVWPYVTAGTGLSDETAIWLFQETNIPVITRDGSTWLRGVKIE